MPITGPWYVTVTAVREYLEIKGLNRDDEGSDFATAEQELTEMACKIVESGKAGRDLDSGAIQYRGGRPLRLRLTVNPAPRREGGKPQLVRVQPDHEQRGPGPYSVPNGVNPPKRVRDAEKAKRAGGPSGAPGTHAYGSYPIRAPDDEREAWRRAAAAAGCWRIWRNTAMPRPAKCSANSARFSRGSTR